MAKDVKLLVIADAGDGSRKGEVIDQRGTGHQWGKKECPPKFVQVRINGVDDKKDFRERFESGQHLDDAGGGHAEPVVVRDYSPKWKLPTETVDEIAGEDKQRVCLEVDLVDQE